MALPVRKNKAPPAPPTCPLTECMALLAGAWAPNVIWYLSRGPRPFVELRHDIPRVSACLPSARLRELQGNGFISRRVVATTPPSAEYELTELGRELLPAFEAIARVGARLKSRHADDRR